MENDLTIVEGLTGEQLLERTKSYLLELEYWRQLIADCARVNDAVLDGTNAVLTAGAGALSLSLLVDPTAMPIIEQISEQHGKALAALKAIVVALDGTLELADGRRKALEPIAAALQRAAGLARDDDSEPRA